VPPTIEIIHVIKGFLYTASLSSVSLNFAGGKKVASFAEYCIAQRAGVGDAMGLRKQMMNQSKHQYFPLAGDAAALAQPAKLS